MKPRIEGLHRALGPDLYQEVWVKLLRQNPQPQWTAAQLMKVAKTTLRDMLRKERRRKHLSLTGHSDIEDHSEDLRMALLRSEDRFRLHVLVTKLSLKLQETIEIHIQITGTDVQRADCLHLPLETFRTRKKMAIKRLRILAGLREE